MFRCCCRCSNDNNNDNLKKQTLQLSSISKISDIFLLNDKNRSNNVVCMMGKLMILFLVIFICSEI